MSTDSESTRLPLFPLPNVVHFPATHLKLHVFEPRYRRLVHDLMELTPESRFIGMVLLKPGTYRSGPPEVFPGGTAGLLVDIESLPDGRSNILLHGDFRFEIEREMESSPYRTALVRPVQEPLINEHDAGILSVRHELIEVVETLAGELGERFPIRPQVLLDEPESMEFEQLVNSIAAEIDLPILTKMSLLTETLPERALSLLQVLRNRCDLLEMLKPFRHLASDAELN